MVRTLGEIQSYARKVGWKQIAKHHSCHIRKVDLIWKYGDPFTQDSNSHEAEKWDRFEAACL